MNSCGTVATVLDFGPSRKLRKEKVEKEGGKKVFISNIFKTRQAGPELDPFLDTFKKRP